MDNTLESYRGQEILYYDKRCWVVKNMVAVLLIFLLKRYVIRIYIIFWVLNASSAPHLLFRRRFIAATRLPRACRRATAARASRAKLYTICDDFGAILFLPVLAIPAARLHAAFHKDRTPLLEILRHCISLPPEDDDVVKIGLLLLLAIAVFEHAIGRDAKVANVHARGERAQFRIARKVAEDKCFVEIHVLEILNEC